MKDFFCLIFILDLVSGVFIKNEPPSTKPPPQAEELPWLEFFEHQPQSDHHREDVGRRGRDRIERQYVGLSSYSTLCPPGETGQFHYPPDCKRFINCWNGRGAIQVCAPGTLFNPETSECDFPGRVKCADGDLGYGEEVPMPSKERYVRFPHERPPIAENPRIARKDSNQEHYKPDSIPAKPYPGRPPYFGPSHLKPPTRPTNQTGEGREIKLQCAISAAGLYPHPYDCTKFLDCWNGKTTIKNCGPGTFFNPLISTCDHPSNVPCTQEEGSVVPFPDVPGVVTEDVQIPEESVRYEQYQDVNQNVKGGKKTLRPSTPSQPEPVRTEIISSTPQTEIDDLKSPAEEDKTSRQPKVINIGSSHKKVSSKEPVHYLTPPQYDVYGNLISSNTNKPPPLGVQPGQPNTNNQNFPSQKLEPPPESGRPYVPLHAPQTPKTPPNSPVDTNAFPMNYPPQGPYAMNQLGNFPTKNYYGYILNKQHPHHHPYFHRRHHPHHPYHVLVPPMYFQHRPMQHFLHYAPQHPFHPKTDGTYVSPQGSVHHPQFVQYPYYPIGTPGACVSNDNSNNPSAPKCEPGMSFYRPIKYDETPKPLPKPTNDLLCSKSPSNNHDPSALECEPGTGFYEPNKIHEGINPSTSSQTPDQSNKQPSPNQPNFSPQGHNSKPESDDFLSNHTPQGGSLNSQFRPGYVVLNPHTVPAYYYPSNIPQNPNVHPQTLPGGINFQPNNANYYPSNSPQTPNNQPGSTHDSQPQTNFPNYHPSNYPQTPDKQPVSTNDLQPQTNFPNYYPSNYPQTPDKPPVSTDGQKPQTNFPNYYPSNSPQSPNSKPGSTRDPQVQTNLPNYYPSNSPQTSNNQLGSTHDSQPQTNFPNYYPFNSPQGPNSKPGSTHDPQPQAHLPNYYPSNSPQTPNKQPSSTNDPQVQTNLPNYYPSNSPQTPNKQPTLIYNPQGQTSLPNYYPSNFPQSSNPDLNPSHQPGFPQTTQPNSGTYRPSNTPQISTPDNNPQSQPGSPSDSQPNPQTFNPSDFFQSPDTSTHPQNRPGSVYSPQYNFLPNFYPASYQPAYYPNQNTQQNYPSNIYTQTTTEPERETGQVALPDPFPVSTDTEGSNHSPEGQVQVPDPFRPSPSVAPNNYNHIDLNNRYPVYPGKLDNPHSTKESENIQGSPSENIVSVQPPPATFPPFPGNAEKPNKSSIKSRPKVDPSKDYILDKIDLRNKPEKEEVESIPSVPPPKNEEKVDQDYVKQNAKPSHNHPNKYSQPEVDETKPNKVKNPPKKTIKAESDFDDFFTYPSETEVEKPKKVIQKPYVRIKQTPPSGQVVRLRNGASHLDGYLEMKDSKSKWGLVCDESGGWEIAEATVACRELGFIRGAELSWQGYPIKSDVEELLVAVNGLNCTGKETSLSECKVTYSNNKNCDIGRNAVGFRCYDNLASHCQPEEILYNQHCYKLHGKENPDDPVIKTEQASEHCKKFGGKLVDITSQYENDFLSEWLIKKHPEVTSVATGGIGISVLGRPMWLWEGTSDPMVYERWWSGWSGEQNIPKGSINGPLCIVLKKTFSCSDSDDDSQKIVESDKDEETCSADYFFWDVEDCEKLRTSVYICERPMDDIGCVVGNGEGYVGTANTTASGQPCLSWDHPKVLEGLARRGAAQERSARLSGHNYCRNLGNPDRHPWCFVEGRGNSEYCAIPRCWDSEKE